MAKLGMPSVIISFKEAGIEAIERSMRGIVMLILEEEQSAIDEIVASGEILPITLYTTDDIPEVLSDDNKDYITKCFLGYDTTPYRVRVMLQPKAADSEVATIADDDTTPPVDNSGSGTDGNQGGTGTDTTNPDGTDTTNPDGTDTGNGEDNTNPDGSDQGNGEDNQGGNTDTGTDNGEDNGNTNPDENQGGNTDTGNGEDNGNTDQGTDTGTDNGEDNGNTNPDENQGGNTDTGNGEDNGNTDQGTDNGEDNQGGNTDNNTPEPVNPADKWNDSLKVIATERWDYLAIPTIETAQLETVATWLKTNRENKHKRSKVVLPRYSGDYEGIINFSNEFVQTATKTYTPAEYTARIAGLIAGTSMLHSATYAPLSEVINCDKYPLDENDEKVNKGEFFIWFDGTKYKMSRAMNSLVTTTEGKLESYQTIKIIDIMDMIYDDIKTTAEDSYIGKYANSYNNKMLLCDAIMGYLQQLENEGLLQAGYSTVTIDTAAVKNYQISHGLYTKEELADMSDIEIDQLDTKKQVLLTGKIKIIDAMEDITLPFEI